MSVVVTKGSLYRGVVVPKVYNSLIVDQKLVSRVTVLPMIPESPTNRSVQLMKQLDCDEAIGETE